MRIKCIECYRWMVLDQKLPLNRERYKCGRCSKEVLVDYNNDKES